MAKGIALKVAKKASGGPGYGRVRAGQIPSKGAGTGRVMVEKPLGKVNMKKIAGGGPHKNMGWRA